MQLVSTPAMGINPQLNISADPEFNALALAPIPPVLGTDTDAARQFYRSNVSQIRMSPLPSLSRISQGAQAQSQVIITQSSQGGGGSTGSVGINLLVNNVANPVQDTLNLTGPGVSYGPGKGQVSFAGSGNYQEVQEAGTPALPEPILNFLAPITVTDNPGNTSSDIAVPQMTGDTGAGGTEGLVPAPPPGSAATGEFLAASGVWAVPAGSGGIGLVTVDLTGQSANIAATTLVTPSVAGYYRVSAWIVATAVDGGIFVDALPAVNVLFTDGNSSASLSLVLIQGNASTTAIGNFGTPSSTWAGTMYVKASTAIQYSTSGYASPGGGSLRYALHLRLEGPF